MLHETGLWQDVQELPEALAATITSHPAAAALSARIGVHRGLDVDRPAWTDDYYRVARQTV